MTQWIAGITRGHNAGVCLLKDGEVVWRQAGVSSTTALTDKIGEFM